MPLQLFKSAAALPAGFWRWPHVDPAKEWADRQDGTIGVDEEFMDAFEKLRALVGHALPINSGYRSPAHNQQEPDHTSDGAHTTGAACDVAVSSHEDAYYLVGVAQGLGFKGIGVSVKNGDGGAGFVHLDMAPSRPEAPRPAVWSY